MDIENPCHRLKFMLVAPLRRTSPPQDSSWPLAACKPQKIDALE